MSRTFIVTEYQKGLLTGTLEEGKLTKASFFPEMDQSLLGNIYVARVIDVVQNLRACFVQIAPSIKCFLPLDTCKNVIVCNREADGRILQQDIVVVQVEKDAAKSKNAFVTGKLQLSGEYCVVLNDRAGIQYSKKMTNQEKDSIKAAVDNYLQSEDMQFARNYGIIIRTQACNSGSHYERLLEELKELSFKMKAIYDYASKRTVYSVLYKREESYIEELKKCVPASFDQIITDQEEVYEQLLLYLKHHKDEKVDCCRLYQDETISLKNLYNLETRMTEALSRKVWLKCGGNLVIDELEALTVIDVNTAKSTQMKSSEENFLKVNLEACEEIGRQLMLRNLSGMIVIDFINLKQKSHEEQMLNFLKQILDKDPITCKVVDITALGLVEITRKRTYPSLKEQFGGYEHF